MASIIWGGRDSSMTRNPFLPPPYTDFEFKHRTMQQCICVIFHNIYIHQSNNIYAELFFSQNSQYLKHLEGKISRCDIWQNLKGSCAHIAIYSQDSCVDTQIYKLTHSNSVFPCLSTYKKCREHTQIPHNAMAML